MSEVSSFIAFILITIRILIKFTKSRMVPRGTLSLYVVLAKLTHAVQPVS